MESPLNGFITTEQAAEYLKYSPETIRTMRFRKTIPHHKIRGRVFFKIDELDNWLLKDSKKVDVER